MLKRTILQIIAVLALAWTTGGCKPSGDTALVKGTELLNNGLTNEAVHMLEIAVETLPGNALALNQLGVGYQTVGRIDDAKLAYLRAIEIDPSLLAANYNLALLAEAKSDWLEAERHLRTYLAANPNEGHSWARLATVQYQSKKIDDAERSFANAKRLNATAAEDWNTLGLISIQKRRYREAQDRFLWARKLDGNHQPALLNLAILQHQYLGDRKSALTNYSVWLKTNRSEAVAEIVLHLTAQFNPTPPSRPSLPLTLAPTSVTNRPLPLSRSNSAFSPPRAAVAPGPVANLTPARTPAVAPRPVANLTPARTPLPTVLTNVAIIFPSKSIELPSTPAPLSVSPVSPTQPRLEPPTKLPLSSSLLTPPTQEVVQIAEEPPLLPARAPTLSPVKPALPPSQSPQKLSSTEVVASPATDSPNEAIPDDQPDPSAKVSLKKRSVWKRVNPANWSNPVKWFRKDSTNPSEQVSRPPTPDLPKLVPKVISKKTTPLPVPVMDLKPQAPEPKLLGSVPITRLEPSPPRYTAQLTTPLKPGDRASAEVQFKVAAAAHQKGTLAEAINGYRRTIALDPTHHEAHHNLALLALKQGDLPLALLSCENALHLKPKEFESRKTFALALQNSGFFADSAAQLEGILQTFPFDSSLHLAAAGLYAGQLKNIASARRHYQSVLALEPTHPQAAAIQSWLTTPQR